MLVEHHEIFEEPRCRTQRRKGYFFMEREAGRAVEMIHSQNPTRLLRECRISDQRRNQQSARRCERSYATPSLRAIWRPTRLPYATVVDAVDHDRRPFHRAIPAVVARLWAIMG